MKNICKSVTTVLLSDGVYNGHASSNTVTVRIKRLDSFVTGTHTQDITFKIDSSVRGIYVPCNVTVKNSSATVEI